METALSSGYLLRPAGLFPYAFYAFTYCKKCRFLCFFEWLTKLCFAAYNFIFLPFVIV